MILDSFQNLNGLLNVLGPRKYFKKFQIVEVFTDLEIFIAIIP